MRDNKKVRDLLSDPNKKIEEATDPLIRIFRQILKDRNINMLDWSRLMERYLRDPKNRVHQDTKSISWYRGNMNKALTSDSSTWKNFTTKLIRFLNPVAVRITFEFEWLQGKKTTHTTLVYKAAPSRRPSKQPTQEQIEEILKKIDIDTDRD